MRVATLIGRLILPGIVEDKILDYGELSARVLNGYVVRNFCLSLALDVQRSAVLLHISTYDNLSYFQRVS